MSKKLTSMLSQIDTSYAADTSKDSQYSALSIDSPRIFPIYICINEYSRRMEDELDMKPGDKIQVITDDKEYNDGWFFGLNLRTKEEGLYPVVFTQEISTERKPTLMRAKSLKRINSSSGISDSNNSLPYSVADSSSELLTPQLLEATAPVAMINQSSVDRHISVKSTMSDIDKALQDFQFNEDAQSAKMPSSDKEMSNHSIAEETILSNTTDLNVIEGPPKTKTDIPNKSLLASSSLDDVNDIENLDILNAVNWTPEEVTEYFIKCGFDVQSASRFRQHKISGKILFELELTHLKELDVNSFGTRFEMFKEIAALKEAVEMAALGSKRNKRELMPAAQVVQPDVKGHSRKASQSLEDLPLRNNSVRTPKHRPTSLLINGKPMKDGNRQIIMEQPSMDTNVTDPATFASPRRAPKPPSYPSPAQPPKSPMVAAFHTPAGTKYSPGIYQATKSNDSGELMVGTPSSRISQTRNAKSAIFSPSISSLIHEQGKLTNANRSSVIYSPPGDTVESSKKSLDRSYSHLAPNDIMRKEEDSASEESESEDTNSSDRPTSSIYATTSEHEFSSSEEVNEEKTVDGVIKDSKKLKRNSSVLSYFTSKKVSGIERSLSVNNGLSRSSSMKLKKKSSFATSPFRQQFTDNAERETPKSNKILREDVPSPLGKMQIKKKTPKTDERRSVSAKETHPSDAAKAILEGDKNKRSVSEAVKTKKLRAIKTRAPLKKLKTSAFMEGMRNISVRQAMKTADYSGWMSKKGSGAMSTWKTRFFTLHGTRLSYFGNTTDTRERGLIDITAHRVVPAKEDDMLVSLYAASTGKGRYCFKLVPPLPGSKKGLTFTQPRVHYFAVDTKEEMRGWMATLIKTTIDIDTTVPVISSYTTPTVSLKKAKSMLADAREETRKREEERLLNEEENEGEVLWDAQQKPSSLKKSKENKEVDENSTAGVENSSSNNSNTVSTSNITVGSKGFASPYLLASGILSPNLGHSPGFRKTETKDKKETEHVGSGNTKISGEQF